MSFGRRRGLEVCRRRGRILFWRGREEGVHGFHEVFRSWEGSGVLWVSSDAIKMFQKVLGGHRGSGVLQVVQDFRAGHSVFFF